MLDTSAPEGRGERLTNEWHWDRFDNSQNLLVGFKSAPGCETRLVYEKNTFQYFIVQSCPRARYSSHRQSLLALSRVDNNFVTNRFTFEDEGKYYIGSQYADTCLADIIDCTLPLRSEHASAILRQLVGALIATSSRGLIYNRLNASKVYISRGGVVQLASFGHTLEPSQLHRVSDNPDAQAIGNLALHILRGRAPIVPQNSGDIGQKRSTIDAGRVDIAIASWGPAFADFLDQCLPAKGSTGIDVAKLHHHEFIRNGSAACLIPLVLNAERSASRPCRKEDPRLLY
ncbi:hypothetical protein EG329_003771 [Mollisiaceae sp. DMI_Dod_QoI]|nr:hypothetical protein EG329_003771 [Helotiales sp. DMI_Dod_QoI]